MLLYVFETFSRCDVRIQLLQGEISAIDLIMVCMATDV